MDYNVAFDRLMGHEGGYSDNPDDPGNWTGGKVGVGKLLGTKWGLAANTYPHLDIKNLTREDARKIYRRDFWEQIHGDEMYDGLAFQAFDFAVNSGIPTAIRYLQRAVGVADDGIWGPRSKAAAEEITESDAILRFLAERLEFMTKLTIWDKFGRGWARRIAQNLRYGAEDS